MCVDHKAVAPVDINRKPKLANPLYLLNTSLTSSSGLVGHFSSKHIQEKLHFHCPVVVRTHVAKFSDVSRDPVRFPGFLRRLLGQTGSV